MLRAISLVCLLLISSTAAPSSDLTITISPNGPSYLAPGDFRTVGVTVRNLGPDTAQMPVVVSAEYLVFPIGEVQLSHAPQSTCDVVFTDFTMPNGQRLEIISFAAPPIAAGASYSCNIGVTALARGRQMYLLRLGVNDISKGASDPNPANSIAEFQFVFFLVTQLPSLSVTGFLMLLGLIALLTKRNLK